MIRILFILLTAISCSAQKKSPATVSEKNNAMKTIHDFKVPAIDGGTIDFASFRGKKILIVNTASECGYTPQYKQLEELYQMKKNDLVVIGFPANNFGGQEPGSNSEILAFCEKNYGVTFPLAAKVSVTGTDQDPLFTWLTSIQQNGVMDGDIQWNFTKFLVDENGKLIDIFPSKVSPLDDELTGKL